jgi:hypothetical protein
MATATIVITYTVGVAEAATGGAGKEPVVTGATIAAADLLTGATTNAQKQAAYFLCKATSALLVEKGQLSLGVSGKTITT